MSAEEKTKLPSQKLSKKLAPFVNAMDFVHQIIAERDEAIEKMERMRRWDLRPHSRKRTGLPCPRIEFEHVPSEDGWGIQWCMYWLVIELPEFDIRAEDPDGKIGEMRERYIPMGETKAQTSGPNPRPVFDGKVQAPFRDGAHAQWDRDALGLPNLPIFARCEDDVTQIEAHQR